MSRMKKNIKTKKSVRASTASDRKIASSMNPAFSDMDDAMLKQIDAHLQPYCTMCRHFGWHFAYLFLMSARAELLELAPRGKLLYSDTKTRRKIALDEDSVMDFYSGHDPYQFS